MRGNCSLGRRAFLAAFGALAVAGPSAAQPLPRRRPPAPWAAAADAARGFDRLHALVVVHRGETVFAEAFRGPPLDRPVNVKSVAKSVVAALTGAALDRGELPGLDATLGEVAPRLIPRRGRSAGGADLARRPRHHAGRPRADLRAGLRRMGVEPELGGGRALPAGGGRAGPGMLYSTGSVHVLGAVLATVSGESLLAQARERIGDPLGIEIPAWTRDPQGFYLGGNEMALAPLPWRASASSTAGAAAPEGRRS